MKPFVKPSLQRAKENIQTPQETSIKFEKSEPILQASSVSIPEFLESEPYPYFYHTWNKRLMCNVEDVKEAFHINDNKINIYISNEESNNNCNNFSVQHNKYGNSLQNYYDIIEQTQYLQTNWRDQERINITNLTPIYLQKCENIMTTMLFMPLDQCHDFRGGRTTGSSSWVTEISKGTLMKDINVSLENGITDNLYSNDFMNTLVKTSFSGKKNIVGIMVIGDDSMKTLLSDGSPFKISEDSIDIQKIMDSFGQLITIASDITMNCDPKGNRLKVNVNENTAQIIFLGFTSDGWDRGMHDVWSMNERKHIYSIKIDKIKQIGQ
jgi:hypothetical protein